MNTQIQRDFEFQAAVHFEGAFMMNTYSMTLFMEVKTESIREQNVAMERLKYIIGDSFENSVFVNMKETKIIEKYTSAGLKVCIVPDDPYDQIISLLLIRKANEVCEGRLDILEISLTSKLSDGVTFMEEIETALNALPNDGWWSNTSPSLCSKSQNKKEKIVKLIKDEWSDMGLCWQEKKLKHTDVVFTLNPEKSPE